MRLKKIDYTARKKYCPRCKKWKSFESFYLNSAGSPYGSCIDCQRAWKQKQGVSLRKNKRRTHCVKALRSADLHSPYVTGPPLEVITVERHNKIVEELNWEIEKLHIKLSNVTEN